MDLKALTQLSASSSCNLILQTDSLGRLYYYIISSTVNYTVVLSGMCEGQLDSDRPVSFEIVLSSIAPLVDKGVEFQLSYTGGKLSFKNADGTLCIEPLCVENMSDEVTAKLKMYLDFDERLAEYNRNADAIEDLEHSVEFMEKRYSELVIDNYSVSSSPFEESPLEERVNSDLADLERRLEESKDKLRKLQSGFLDFRSVDYMSNLKRIANIASRYSSVVSMCDDYAVVQLTSGYVFQKSYCGVRAIQGRLLSKLLSMKDGHFFEMNGGLVFCHAKPKAIDKSRTVVFIASYMPNTKASSTLITKGAVLEKYSLKLKSLLQTISPVLSKFDVLKFDMGSAKVIMENDSGEKLSLKFSVEDAKTVELNKLLRGEQAGEIVMSTVSIPKELHRILSYFEEGFTLYVKKNRNIIQSGDLYVVFGGVS